MDTSKGAGCNSERLVGLPETVEACLEGPAPATCAEFNPFGTLLATGCRGGEIVIWSWSTRTPARTLTDRHSKAVTAVKWSPDGRHLLSASLDGSLAVTDVLSGAELLRENLGRGGIAGLSVDTAISSPPLDFRERTDLVVSYCESAAEIVRLGDLANRTAIPCAALDGEGRGLRLLTGRAAAAAGQLAAVHSGRVVSAGRGVVYLLSLPDLEIVDAVRLRGPAQRIVRLEFNAAGSELLVVAKDRWLRLYDVPAAAGLAQLQPLSESELAAAVSAGRLPKEGPLVHTAGAPSRPAPLPSLRLIRVFESQVERCAWGCGAFSPDGLHVVSSVDSRDEHIIYTWNVPHGYPENTLETGRDGVTALTWHPQQTPMQLVAVGATGRLHVWSKVLTQDWTAFAPDFETLEANREHVEAEIEFDVQPPSERPTDEERLQQAQRAEDEEVDVGGWEAPHGFVSVKGLGELRHSVGGTAAAGGSDADGPLVYLPVVLPTAPAEESEEEFEDAVEGSGGGVAASVDEGRKEENEGGGEVKAEAMEVEGEGGGGRGGRKRARAGE